MKVVIFSGGKLEDGFFVREAIKSAELIIAADSGAESALKIGITPQIIVGDMDSFPLRHPGKSKRSVDASRISERFWTSQNDENIEIIKFSPQKDETDTQLAVDVALQRGATEISILGGVQGNRLDHVLGNVFLSGYLSTDYSVLSTANPPPSPSKGGGQLMSSLPAEGKHAVQGRVATKIFFINANQKSWIESGPHSADSGQATEVRVSGKKGDLLSLLPLSETVEDITTKNLQYPLKNETLYFGIPRGISNIFLGNECSVSFKKGRLLFVQTKTI